MSQNENIHMLLLLYDEGSTCTLLVRELFQRLLLF